MGVSNIYERGSRLYVTVQDSLQGIKPHRRALHCRVGQESKAASVRYAIERELASGKYKPPVQSPGWDDFMETYEKHYVNAAGPDRMPARRDQWTTNKYHFDVMLAFLKQRAHTTPKSVAVKDAEAYRDARMSEGKALASVKHYIRIAKAAWNWAIRHEYADHNPWVGMAFPKEVKADPRNLSEFEVRRVMTYAREAEGYDVFARMALALYGGLRVGETYRLQRTDLDWEKSEIRLGPGKDLEPRSTVFPPELQAILRPYKEGAGSVLPGGPSQTFRHTVRRISVKTGVDFSAHDLRRTFAGMLWERGVDPKRIQFYLGHAKMETTLAYYVRRSSEVAEKDKGVLRFGVAAS